MVLKKMPFPRGMLKFPTPAGAPIKVFKNNTLCFSAALGIGAPIDSRKQGYYFLTTTRESPCQPPASSYQTN